MVCHVFLSTKQISISSSVWIIQPNTFAKGTQACVSIDFCVTFGTREYVTLWSDGKVNPERTVDWRPYLLLVGGDSGEGTKSPWLSAAEEEVIPSSYPSSTSFSSEKPHSSEKYFFTIDLPGMALVITFFSTLVTVHTKI